VRFPRSAWRGGLSAVAATIFGASVILAQNAGDSLRRGFENPPDSARPRVWWHWMNGNITWEGAQADMDWMKRIGIAGLQSFDAGFGPTQVVEQRLPYMSDGWKQVFRNTAAYADKVGLELGIAASPGWSETGGPWVQGPDAMKKMSWSVTRVHGGQPLSGTVQKPPTTTGIFQTSTAGWRLGGRAPGQNPPEYYADQKVLAFRVPSDAILPKPTVTASGGTLHADALSDGDIQNNAIDLPDAPETGGISWLQFDYGHPVTVRGLTLSTSVAGGYFDGLQLAGPDGTPPLLFRLESSDDGQNWRDTGAQVQTGNPERTVSVDSMRARYFRFISVKQPPAPPQPTGRWGRQPGPPPASTGIRELVLRGEATVHSFEEKAAFLPNAGYYRLPTGTASTAAAPKSSAVVDLTSRMKPDGSLDWTPAKGEWLVLRIGYSLTGAMNRPASLEATGLEVDKLDRDAVKRYMDTYLGLYRDASGGLLGQHGVRAMMFDSWEASHENWTPKILQNFQRLRGYDPTPWLPALAGYVVDSPERSDAFLWDWRRTLQQLLKENHYDFLSSMLHSAGMIRYGEAQEATFATMGDGMEMKQSADLPMGAMWMVANKSGDIEDIYFNDLQESASVAHIYGQNLVACESLTGGPPFGSAPWDLKPTADAILLAGVNRIVIHTSTHQPVSKGPGITLGVGQYFTRLETWAEQAKPWIDYLSRSSFLLQQGQAAHDIAVFYGEAGPIIAPYRDSLPAVPNGYRYDYVNADAILNKLTLRDGAMTTGTGMRYRALFIGHGAERISLPVLRKMRDMVRDGAVLIGPRPLGSPSLADSPQKVKAILDTLWPGTPMATVGKGRVFAADDATEPLRAIKLEPDFTYTKPSPDSRIMFLHRRLADGDAYFVANRSNRAETIEASFRVTGRKAEFWDPTTGLIKPAPYRIEGGRTGVTVPLDPLGALFVVFREAAGSELTRTLPATKQETVLEVSGPWQVAFQADRGAPATATFENLADFRENSDPGIRYFSGVATYSKEIPLPAVSKGSEAHLWLDLGQVGDLAEVWVNGKLMGTAWKPPYRVDIASAAVPGANRIEIKAVNLWVNRLIGDVQPGVTQKITFTWVDGKPLPPGPSRSRPTGMPSRPDEPLPPGLSRGRPAAMPYRPDAPLRPSGLIGPVKVVSEISAPQ
jgi:alpha-L-rhamnosidase